MRKSNVHFVALVLLVLLSGCTSGKSKPVSYTSPTGSVTLIENDREACLRSCDTEYSRCGDTAASQRVFSTDIPASFFGAPADCRKALEKCITGCKSR